MVVGFLKDYETHSYAGATVDLASGRYFDPSKSSNWWENYFEPIVLGDKENASVHYPDDNKKREWAYWPLKPSLRKEVSRIIKKYIRIKPHISEKVDEFTAKNFQPFMIGVHYRGTDKNIGAYRVSYEIVTDEVEKIIKEKNLEKFSIFVASDEASFIEHISQKFENVVWQDAMRSPDGKPFHVNAAGHNLPIVEPYRLGEEALIDCMLLSKCNVMIRTTSNLSIVAAQINPEMEVINIWKDTVTKERF